MKIELHDISVRDLVDGYTDDAEKGVRAYGGKLDVRPPYQREFVYKPAQRNAVIDTLRKDFPLNVMYWSVREDGTYEIIDGQQRTISICQFVDGDFAFNQIYFHNLQKDQQEQVLNYQLKVYLCSGTDSEKLEWFKTINIAGEELTDQELRNAVYAGSWVTDAKRHFSRPNSPAMGLGSDYVNKSAIRQELLELVIKWYSDGDVEGYMGKNQHKPQATELWVYFQNIIAWVRGNFPVHRSEMKSVQWGQLYNTYKDANLDSDKLEERIRDLLIDDEVQNNKGIWAYVLDGNERQLHLRQFTEQQRRQAYELQNGICHKCGKHFKLEEMQADHVTPWSKGGETNMDNCKMLCALDNRLKSDV